MEALDVLTPLEGLAGSAWMPHFPRKLRGWQRKPWTSAVSRLLCVPSAQLLQEELPLGLCHLPAPFSSPSMTQSCHPSTCLQGLQPHPAPCLPGLGGWGKGCGLRGSLRVKLQEEGGDSIEPITWKGAQDTGTGKTKHSAQKQHVTERMECGPQEAH